MRGPIGAAAGARPWGRGTTQKVGTQAFAQAGAVLAGAFAQEVDNRRLFLWLPVAAGAGAILSITADHDPSLPFCLALFAVLAGLACGLRRHRLAFTLAVAAAAILAGYLAVAVRIATVGGPVLDRIRIATLTGFVEELDLRPVGARFLLRVETADGLERKPFRVRLTTRTAPSVEAGGFVQLKARLLPPARASIPEGYDFARDAYFAGLGAVGNVLGRLTVQPAPHPASLSLRVHAAIDGWRNRLAQRISAALPGPSGAVAVAMVTGKRDFLEEGTKDLIREAGIFHIITISGVQMTLVAGVLFGIARRLLALSRTLALRFPIKRWAAAFAMVGAIGYDLATGSRVGTERALVMTLIMMGAVLCGRRALTMRNLALAALAVVVFEPEALLGASFQLSFAAVAGLVAVQEAKAAARVGGAAPRGAPTRNDRMLRVLDHLREGPGHALLATACATAATASFMAFHFHELSPYVLIGNPLTLLAIEFCAIPAALIGSVLYPLGLDGWVWPLLGLGIDGVLKAASWLAAMPGSTLHLHAFAPLALVPLALAVLSAVLWRTLPIRLAAAIPLLALGIAAAVATQRRFDVAIAPGGDALALRGPDGALVAFGDRPSAFAVEQWLRAAGDSRAAASATRRKSDGASPDDSGPRCDRLGCVASLPDGGALSLVLDPAAFAEDCRRADVIVSRFYAPATCAAALVLDRRRLTATGAVTVTLADDRLAIRTARNPGEDRPWSPAPRVAERSSSRSDGSEDTADETPWPLR